MSSVPDWGAMAHATSEDGRDPRVPILEAFHHGYLKRAADLRAMAAKMEPVDIDEAGKTLLAAQVAEAIVRGMAWVIADIDRLTCRRDAAGGE